MFLFSLVYGYFLCMKHYIIDIIWHIHCSLITIGPKSAGIKRVGNNYDQAQLRSIKMADPNTVSLDNRGLCQHRTSFAVHTAPGKSHGTDYFFGREKPQRQKISGGENSTN